MAQALYRKWRPQTFDDVVGQEHIVKTLRYALRTGHIHHAYLLAGPRGTGKTTTARLIAKAVNCQASPDERPCNTCEICTAINDGRLMDLVEIDAASNTGVDNIRDLLEKVGFRPTQATYKVYVIDEVHMLSTAAFNALLKTLEEPPEHVIFVLATTEVHKIPETILSRCQRFEFRRIPLQAIIARLDAIASAEQVEAEPEALELIARAATGSMRDAISLFDQMAASGAITGDFVRMMLGAERREVVRSLLSAWVDRDLTRGLQVINEAIDGGADPRELARQTADFFRGLLLMRLGAGHTWTDPTADERTAFEAMARRANPDHLVEAVRLFSDVAAKQRTGWQPQLPLELAFVEASLHTAAVPVVGAPATAPAAATRPVSQSESARPAVASRAAAAERPARTSEANAVAEGGVAAARLASTPSRGRETPVAEGSPKASAETASKAPASDVLSKATGAGSVEAASTEAASTEATSGEGASGGITPDLVETIKVNWSGFIKQMPVSIGALLRDADVGGQDAQGRLVLAFKHTFHCDKISEDANLRKLESILSRAYGATIPVHCVLAENWHPQPASAPVRTAPFASAPPPRAPQKGAPASEDGTSLEEDELIRRAQEELGAVARVND